MATPARSLEVGGSHETPSLLVEPLLASSSSPSVRTPKDSVNYHQQPLTSSSAALSLGATAKEYPPNGSQQLHNQISDATSAQWNPQQFNIAAGHIRGFLSQHQGKVAPVPLVRSHTFPSSISPGLAPSWEATSRIESQAPPIDIQRPSSAFSSQSLDTDNIRLDKRRKTRHSSPDDEDMEHLQLRFAGHYPQHSQAGPALAQHALAQRLYPQASSYGDAGYPRLSSLNANTNAHANATLPSRSLSAQPTLTEGKRKADALATAAPQVHNNAPSPAPSYYSHTSFDDVAHPVVQPLSSPPPVDPSSLHAQAPPPAISTRTRERTQRSSDDDAMSSGASDYQPDSSTPAKSHRELGNMPKQRRKKASQKAAALVSDPDYATTSTSKVPRINKKPDSGTKPSYSYAALIGQAILNSQNKLLSLNDIYCFIMVNYTFFKKDVAGWQNSIRHNLSLNDSFLKVARGPENPGKGSLWTIKPGDEDLFVNGGYVKRAALSKSRAGSNASSTGRPERSSTQQGRSSSPELTLESPSPTKLDPPAQLEVKPQLSRHSSYRSARATSVKEESVEPEQEASRSPTPEPFAQVVVQEPSAQSQRPADIYEGDQEPDDSGVELQTNAPQNELEPVKIAHSTLEVVASRASRQSSPCDSISDPSEPTKPHTSTSQSIGGLGEPVSLDMMSKRPAVHEDEDAAESSTGPFSEVRGGRMYIPSPVSRLRSPARRSHARVPSFDYSTLGGGHTSADGRSKVFGTPQRPGPPGAFQSPAYYFSSDAYGDPNDLHSIVVAELDRRDMSPVASTSNQHMSIFNTPSYARTLGKPW